MKEQFLSKSNEWFTPPLYLNLVREVLGYIELDPASCGKAQETVKAIRFFNKADDGLSRDWSSATLFLNPPYGKTGNDSNAGIWAKKLIRRYELGICKQAILLVNASTGANWFNPLWGYPICFTDHRIRFISAITGEPETNPTKDNCFVYFGNQTDKFAAIFETVGATAKRYPARH